MKGRWLAPLLGLVILAGWVLQVDRTRDRLRAQTILKTVQVVSSQLMASGRLSPRLLWGHVRLLEEAERLDPSDAALPLARGSQHLLLDRPEEAIEAYLRALALERRPETHLNLGRAYARRGQPTQAREHFQAAVTLAPHLRRQVPPEYRPSRGVRSPGR